MFKEIQFTLYDIFGYLLPGAILLLAMAFLFWAFFWTHETFTFPSTLSAMAVTTLLLASYLAGHLTQALGNGLEKMSAGRKKLNQEPPLSTELRDLVLQALVERFGEKVHSLDASELFHLCDQTLIQEKSPQEEREIFTYREGFYRGNTVALTVMTLALIVRLIRAPAFIGVSESTFSIGRAPLAMAAALTALAAWLCYRRFLRFARHRYRRCFVRFLALASSSQNR